MDVVKLILNDKNTHWQIILSHAETFAAKMPHLMCFYHLQVCTVPNLIVPSHLNDMQQMLRNSQSIVNGWKGTEHQIIQRVSQEINVLYDCNWELPVLFYPLFVLKIRCHFKY